MSIAYIGLGSNLEPRFRNLQEAIRTLEQQIGTLLKCSSFIETQPWGFTSDHNFLNAVASFETRLSPSDLLKATEQTELMMGRTHKSHEGHYEDRIIDIDILLYDQICIQSPQLTIPHPRLHQRQFVLMPLAEIAPDMVVPSFGMTARQLSLQIKL